MQVGCEAEKSNGKFNCDFKLKDNQTGRQEYMNIEAQVQGDKVEVDLKSSISGFESVKTTGTKKVRQHHNFLLGITEIM